MLPCMLLRLLQPMQLAARRVLLQLERPLSALFAHGLPHQPNEMAALVDHFLQMVRDGVAGSHATRTCAICLEQLLCAYGTMLFLQEDKLTDATPQVLATDLGVFQHLLVTHCAAGPFASRHKAAARVRASALLQLLGNLHALLERILSPGGAAFKRTHAAPGPSSTVDVEALVALATQLWARQPALTRDILGRLLGKCQVPQLRGKKGNALLDACEAGVKRAAAAKKERHEQGRRASASGSKHQLAAVPQDVAEAEECRACERFFNTVAEALRMGRKQFTVLRLLELQGSATRRWD